MDRRIRIAVDRLNADINTHVSVAALARLVNLSRWRFAHLFKREMSVPVSHYVTSLRMQAAQRMLSETFLSIKEIRVRLGNIDRSHFNREFKRRTGLTPTEFRRRLDKSE
jgi:AraC-like DNA-binding protein